MRYKNASDILPDKLLREIQKYTSGEAIYIPSSQEHSSWGEKSGAKGYYTERNQRIVESYQLGKSMDIIAGEFCLSVESVRKIIYRWKKEQNT